MFGIVKKQLFPLFYSQFILLFLKNLVGLSAHTLSH